MQALGQACAIVVVTTTLGCSAAPLGRNNELQLPFMIAVHPIVIVSCERTSSASGIVRKSGDADVERDHEQARPPNDSLILQELTKNVTERLKESRLFTEVACNNPDRAAPDLELSLSFEDGSFGDGRLYWGGACLSTVLWLFVGPLSWGILDAQYPEAQVRLIVSIREVCEPNREVFRDSLWLKDLQLNFWDRISVGNAFLNIVWPACLQDGDTTRAGISLTERSLDRFINEGLARIQLYFPDRYQEANKCYLHFQQGEDKCFVVSSAAIDVIEIRSEKSADWRRLIPDTSDVRLDSDISMESRFASYGDPAAKAAPLRVYSVALRDNEVDLVRIRAITNDNKVCSWSISRTVAASKFLSIW
jgi:hypothetical protein